MIQSPICITTLDWTLRATPMQVWLMVELVCEHHKNNWDNQKGFSRSDHIIQIKEVTLFLLPLENSQYYYGRGSSHIFQIILSNFDLKYVNNSSLIKFAIRTILHLGSFIRNGEHAICKELRVTRQQRTWDYKVKFNWLQITNNI